MNLIQNVDKKKSFELFTGIVGINLTFLVAGVLYEWITKLPYRNYDFHTDVVIYKVLIKKY